MKKMILVVFFLFFPHMEVHSFQLHRLYPLILASASWTTAVFGMVSFSVQAQLHRSDRKSHQLPSFTLLFAEIPVHPVQLAVQYLAGVVVPSFVRRGWQLGQGYLSTVGIKWFAVCVCVCLRRGKRGHQGIAKKGNVKQRTWVKYM